MIDRIVVTVGDNLIYMPTLAYASVDSTDLLVNYGPLGIFAALSIYAIKKMYDAITKNYETRLAETIRSFEARIKDRDQQIEDRDKIIDKQDVTISLLLRHGQNSNVAMERVGQVMEALPRQLPVDDLAQVKDVLTRAAEVLERVEGERK